MVERKRLVLVACIESTTTPWQRLTGRETAVRVCDLEVSGELELVCRGKDGVNFTQRFQNGVHPVRYLEGEKLQIMKLAGARPQATTVELIYE